MRAIGTFDAKNVPGSLVGDTTQVGREAAQQAAADILAASKGVTLGGVQLHDLIDEGRP
jgi:hypothetical protein